MKKYVALLTALLLVLFMMPTSAANKSSVLKGTPTLDGKLDNIYLDSAVITIEKDETQYLFGGADLQPFDKAISYLLWDEEYLYIFASNDDDTPINRGATGEVWQNDSAEFWFIDENLEHKVHCAADGNLFLGSDADGICAYDFSEVKRVSTFTDTGWAVELAIPLNKLAAGRTFSYKFQVNNIVLEDGSAGSASAGGFLTMTCVNETSGNATTGNTTTAADSTTTTATSTTTTQADVTTVPSTTVTTQGSAQDVSADTDGTATWFIVLGGLLIAVGVVVGIVVLKKRNAVSR